jgi:RIO kinase 2
LYMKEHGIDGDVVEGEVERDNDDEDEEDDDEEVKEAEEDIEPEALDNNDIDTSGPVKPLTESALSSYMTILDIADSEPLPDDLSAVKPPPQPTISTKAAKKKAGWAI